MSALEKFYSPSPAVRARQMIGDAAVFAWSIFWLFLGYELYHLINKLGGAGRLLQRASGGLDVSSKLPSALRSSGDALGSAGTTISHAGQLQATASYDLALVIGGLTAVVPLLTVLVPHVLRRVVFLKATRALRAIPKSPDFQRFMAQRALMRQPVRKLMAATPTPFEDFAEGKYEALAALEYGDFGKVKEKLRSVGSR